MRKELIFGVSLLFCIVAAIVFTVVRIRVCPKSSRKSTTLYISRAGALVLFGVFVCLFAICYFLALYGKTDFGMMFCVFGCLSYVWSEWWSMVWKIEYLPTEEFFEYRSIFCRTHRIYYSEIISCHESIGMWILKTKKCTVRIRPSSTINDLNFIRLLRTRRIIKK